MSPPTSKSAKRSDAKSKNEELTLKGYSSFFSLWNSRRWRRRVPPKLSNCNTCNTAYSTAWDDLENNLFWKKSPPTYLSRDSIQEPSEHNLNQNSPIEYLFQSSNGFILAQGLKSVLEIMDSDCIGLDGVLYFTHQNSLTFGAKTLNLELRIAKIMERIVESGVKDIGSTQTLNFNNQLLIGSFVI